ncbi:MAG: discoidin domain-containing protein [Candidatus Hydrogenedentes bacterium]|nr:discoidin domain-containing protein [Candidatus Hydrogenedentota bacterium]
MSGLIAEAALRGAEARIADGQLQVELEFDALPNLRTPWDLYLLIDADGNEATGFQGADYLIQDCTLKGDDKGPLHVAWFELRPGIVTPGESVEATAWIENSSDAPLEKVAVRLELPEETRAQGEQGVTRLTLRPKEAKRLTWKIAVAKPGLSRVALRSEAGEARASEVRWLSIVAKHDPAHEFETATGTWLPYPERPTLQAQNKQPLRAYRARSSAQLKRNLFGITAHLPRSTNDENPFEAAHAVDGDPATCWASRWWRTAIPFLPEWIELDLGKPVEISEVRFLPAWKNSGMPAALEIAVSPDGRRWDTVLDEPDYRPQEAPQGDALRCGDVTWQRFAFAKQRVRYVRLEANRLTQKGTSFFCAPFEPFQFRVAEVSMFDGEGKPINLVGLKTTAASTHAAWYNAPDTIIKTWPLLFKSGVKLNRIGQWGDKVDWATVEQTKGVYRIDREVDRAIDESVKKGVDILLTLDYGNNLYQTLNDSPDFGPTWRRGHPFLQCAPTTPEALEGFANYCAFMADHFRGRVKYFEIWNEENGWFFDAWAENGKVSMAKAYGRALAAAAKAVKQANPEAKVVFGGMAGSSLDFPRIALEAGAGPSIDILAFHPYGHPTPEAAPPAFLTEVDGKMEWRPRPAEITDYESEIAAYRKLMRAHNAGAEVWADEMNWFAPGEPAKPDMGDQSELSQAKYLARFFAINAWLGNGAIWWSLYNSNGVQEWAVLRSSDLSPRAAWYSAGYVSTALDDVRGDSDTKVEVVGAAPKDLLVKTYRNGAGELLIGLWRTSPADDHCRPAPVTLRLPGVGIADAQLVDTLYGRRQKAVTRAEDGGAVIPELLIGDWPVIVRVKLAQSNP